MSEPLTVAALVGGRAALAYFERLPPERLAHGYLFSGPRGTGKRTFARFLARSLLCETPKTALLGACGHCVGCRLFAAGTHPDLVAAEGTLKIGDESGSALHDAEPSARDLVRELGLRPFRAQRRVVLLSEVAFATHEAANALLKFLEEPPAGTVVVLTTSTPGRLLATIRSRLIELAFGPLRRDEIEGILAARGIAPDAAARAASLAQGSLTLALASLEEGGNARNAAFAWFAEAVAGRSPDADFLALDDRAQSGAQKRAAVGELIETSRTALRDWIALTLADRGAPLAAPDQRARLAALGP
ncbi:MAG: ATP-binding protein, partial [Vulcanimicrobiaceae bacterium]